MALTDPNRFFDVRTVRRHIKAGRVEQNDYQGFVEGLPDVSDKIMDPAEGGDDDGYDNRGVRRSAPAEPEPAPVEAAPIQPVAAPAPVRERTIADSLPAFESDNPMMPPPQTIPDAPPPPPMPEPIRGED